MLEEHARRFHGDSLLWAGCHSKFADSVHGCMIRNRIIAIDESSDLSDGLVGIRCALHAIPLPNHSLDAVVLHHTLETVDDPRTAIRELSRVLVPGGRLVVCSFNPISPWGLRTLYARLFTDHFSGLRLVSPSRLADWLTVLGFELQEPVRYLSYSLPFSIGKKPWKRGHRIETALRRRQFPIGGVYLISAVKQAYGIRPDWQTSRGRPPKLAPVAYPKLSAWNRIERPR
ncbi:MAG: SAM-dependent methyltransferase [Gammaproteobacteria bacterium]|nr:MAG: SAM-dependent methyltransferase [Gammaproteobacteria bacterium]